ncbi:MAG TPA: amidase, partial [Candidatus Berkiella sp.]|nr:amidase [Candidatus Berkiella sp.]
MHNLSIAKLSEELSKKSFSSVELTQHFLKRIAEFDKTLNSFITVTEETALAQAKAADAARAAGNAGRLTGIPIAQKDIFCTQGIKTSCGSKMLDNFIAPYDATIVSKMSTAGLVMLGKTNMDEFAMGSSNENSFYGPVRNPWDLETVPGGSSGGSAAAVAARLTPGSTGTDTGGSIRQPAALCGISGLKPTYGRVSRYGMIAFASSLDQGGPFAQTAEDLALLLNSMAGFDERDSTCVNVPVPDYTAQLNESLQGKKIGLPKEYFEQGLDKDVETRVQDAIKVFE